MKVEKRLRQLFVIVLMLIAVVFSMKCNIALATNTFLGTNAGANNTGDNNTFLGYESGRWNKTGDNNTFLGAGSGYSNMGTGNTLIGMNTGRDMEEGVFNTIIGANSGMRMGYQANFNTFLGSYSGMTNTGWFNTFVGYKSGYFNNQGKLNSFFGNKSGYSNTDGTYNTFIGTHSGYYNDSGKLNTFLGYRSGYKNTTGSYNTFIGLYSGYLNSTGNINTFLGYRAGFKNTSGKGNVFLGNYAGYYETGSNKLYIANKYGIPLIYGDFSSKRVGIYKSNPSYTLDVNGIIRGSNVSVSDVRLKKDVLTIENALDKVSKMRGVKYKWIDESKGNGIEVGVIAQEVEKVVPEVVSEDNEGIKSVAYGKLVGVLIEAVKELMSENKQLRKTLTSLTDRQEAIEDMLLTLSTSLPKDKLAKLDTAQKGFEVK